MDAENLDERLREADDDGPADVESRVAELEAAVEALRGYLGSVQAVNDDVERRADLALARTERLTDEGRRSERRDPPAEPARPDDRDRGGAAGRSPTREHPVGGPAPDRVGDVPDFAETESDGLLDRVRAWL
jgi:hypothetical protein